MARAIAVAALALAIVASVFAIWPVIANAPWEDDPGVAVEDRTEEIRCAGALRLRESATEALGNSINIVQLRAVQDQLEEAKREIGTFCR